MLESSLTVDKDAWPLLPSDFVLVFLRTVCHHPAGWKQSLKTGIDS